MPELPDLTVYIESLRPRVVDQPLERARISSPFLLRSVDPPVAAVEGKTVRSVERLGKRIVLGTDGDVFCVLHLMIAGRLRWRDRGVKVPRKYGLAAFDFPTGSLLLTEMGARKRASLHLVSGRAALREHDPGGIDVLASDLAGFRAALTRENHTLKRALTDPRTLSGIGNAYSDEILHRARLSPLRWTSRLTDEEMARLHEATRTTLQEWIDLLRAETGDRFPEKVTAFHAEMAVHGRYKQPCPDCGAPVQRIVYAENETNYCARCQTGGKVLADRALSQLLKKDWPRTLEEWEAQRGGGRSLSE
ncbi:MAG: Fpg/Nei family DNA glycosylase [Planctomycetota bacterium]